MAQYDYTKDVINLEGLYDEILENSVISGTLDYIDFDEPDDLSIYFDEALTGTEQIELDSIVIAHQGIFNEPPDSVTVGLSPPTTVSGSAMWIDSQTSRSYIYNVQRNKWLSVSKSMITYSYAGTVGNNYLSIGEVSYSEAGYTISDNSTITSITLTCREPANDLYYDVITNYEGTDTTIFSFLTVGLKYSNLIIDLDIDADRILKVYARKTGAQSAKDPICIIGIQERYDV